jgi:hypothetical protein
MISTHSIYLSIRHVLVTWCGEEQVIQSHQVAAPTPNGTFSSIEITKISHRGWDTVSYENNPDDHEYCLTETTTGHREITLKIGFFRDNALARSSHFKSKMLSSPVVEYLNSLDIGFVSCEAVENKPDYLQEAWEEQAVLVLKFNAQVKATAQVHTIETAVIRQNDPHDHVDLEVLRIQDSDL